MCFDGKCIQQLSNGNIDKKICTTMQKRTYFTKSERDLHHPLFPFPLQVRALKLIYSVQMHTPVSIIILLHTGMMLKENNTLRKLDLHICRLQPDGLEEVIKGVQINTKLETLDLLDIIDDKRASCLGKNGIMQVCPYTYERALHHISVHYLPIILE